MTKKNIVILNIASMIFLISVRLLIGTLERVALVNAIIGLAILAISLYFWGNQLLPNPSIYEACRERGRQFNRNWYFDKYTNNTLKWTIRVLRLGPVLVVSLLALLCLGLSLWLRPVGMISLGLAILGELLGGSILLIWIINQIIFRIYNSKRPKRPQ